ncbi:CAF17-like 4Fe-4S cluster assembly/insertion protein YgfZ [Marinobacter lutaoensis]|uniref:CAF17-like 4Fe-4S cluster assembly/insertion protein YgfZ n=1 Tax=Marinobacter lutaoensis TaxID=135739 RepID=UPI0015934920|nr:folate-binding protein YgfZ [Marinobacter lutaoensis]NVD34632.1 folate-binding protein YgfZ [Marinobacter lutaoensis]
MTDTDTVIATPSDSDEPARLPIPDTGHARLSDRTLVRVSGPGTRAFLQGQFSQHLDEVAPNHAPRAAAANPKGRAYALTRLARDGEDVLMVLPKALLEATQAQLDKYLRLFRGTTMTPLANAQVWGLVGMDAAAQIAGATPAALGMPADAQPLDSGLLIRVEDDDRGIVRFEFWQTGDTAPDLTGTPELSVADWQARDIAAGVPQLDTHSWEAYVPQMLNWHHLGGVHFKKGCYTGQEVIARMHFLGQLKKSLYRFSCPGGVRTGSRVLAGNQAVGEVVTAVTYTDGSSELLAVVRHDAAGQPLTVEGQPLMPRPLPYPVPEQEGPANADT